jgi:hypothetical protein
MRHRQSFPRVIKKLRHRESLREHHFHVIPAKAGIQESTGWTPACAGVTCWAVIPITIDCSVSPGGIGQTIGKLALAAATQRLMTCGDELTGGSASESQRFLNGV